MNKAFVLGAGFGTRLRPMTHVLPKPLIPVVNKPLIAYAFDRLMEAGATQFIVNTHHLHERYHEAFPDRHYRNCPLQLIHEHPEILETGGGLSNIAPLIRDDSCWVFNGDILSDLPLEQAASVHRDSNHLVTLILRSTGPKPNVAWDPDSGKIRDLRNALGTNAEKQYQFSGIYLIHPDFLDFLRPVRESVVPAFLKVITEHDRLGGVLIDEGQWWDLGTRHTYLEANQSLLHAPGSFVLGERISPSASIAESARIDERTIVGPHCEIGEGAVLAESILWPNARVLPDAQLQRCILTGVHPAISGSHQGQDFEDALDPDTILELSRNHLPQMQGVSFKIEEIHGGGSDRRYFRLKPDIQSIIFCQYSGENVDNSRFAQHTDYLARHDVPVPAIRARDPENHRLWIEDLGSRDLCSVREEDWRVIRRPLYEASILAVARIHAIGKDQEAESDIPPLGPEFDEALYGWEQEYFFNHFVANFSQVDPEEAEAIQKGPELTELATGLSALPRCLIHRDFQSQNIIIQEGRPVFIDYQGLRFGRGEYDLASLIYDPYVPMTAEQREELIRFAETLSSEPAFRSILARCACQRLMQALGAYGFLGLVKQKRSFLNHIRPAVQNLHEVAVSSETLPVLAPLLRLRDFEL